jgi:CAAX amino terminal protease family.
MLNLIDSFREDLASLDRKALFALVYAAFGLTCIYYFKNPTAVATFLDGSFLAAFGVFITDFSQNNLPGLGWWILIVTVFYFLLPVLIIKLVWRADLKDFGLKFSIEEGFWKLLAACTAVMLPITYLMSLTEGFAAKYPFLQIYNGEPYVGGTLIAWELIYFVQFFGLEFFFRGFLVHSLKPSLGLYSIFVMTVPYCMIHFSKPMPETLAAIAAGIFLGWISYKNGSIWLGLILHCMVAFSMDIFALHAKGLLF